MKILFRHTLSRTPLVSFILIDWSCRESFHLFHYLSRQTVPREQYEIIWIEYYDREAPGIRDELREWEGTGGAPPLDQWILMNMPSEVYYHKHLMYNVGIALSRGEIVVICDPDAIVKPSYVESIVKSFKNNPDIVLHMDQVRNNDKKFYPFNYPSLEEVVGPGAVNYKDGKTSGLWEKDDVIHKRNYGACLCAKKSDLLAIGGADEHIHYIGASASPYEITFRLENLGKSEVWHEEEILYHVWHPGQGANNNIVGPHNGKHMSLTALKVKGSGRTEPLMKNQSIALLQKGSAPTEEELFSKLINQSALEGWTHEALLANPDFCLSFTSELLESFEGYNIVRYRDRLYGIIQGLETVDFEDKSSLHERKKNYELFAGETIDEVKKWIEDYGQSLVEIVEAGYYGFNILCFRKKYYAALQSLGDLNLNSLDKNRLAALVKSREIYIGDTLTDVKKWLDRFERKVDKLARKIGRMVHGKW